MYIDKLTTVLRYFSKLSNVVDNDVIKKAVYDKLVTNVNTFNDSGLVLKPQCKTDKLVLEKTIDDGDKKIPRTSGIVKKQIIMLNH